MNAWRRRQAARTLSLAALLQLPPSLTLAVWLHRSEGLPGPRAAGLALGLLGVASAIVLHHLVHWRNDRRSPRLRVWLLEVPCSAWLAACLLAAPLGWLGLLATGWSRVFGDGSLTLPALLGPLYLGVLALSTWGSTLGRIVPRVRTREVVLDRLPAAFDGYRIVQLSDVHCGPYVPRWAYRYWAARARALQPDLIAVTGDLITAGEGYLDDVKDLFRHLSARDGVVACMGNHDYFGTVTGVSEAIVDGGGRLLRNGGFVLRRQGEDLYVAGVDDRWTKRDDLTAALRDRPEGTATVLLAHDPAGFHEIAARGVDLTLSGHSHAGQFALPIWPRRFNLARIAMRHTMGSYRIAKSQFYVHPGNGTSGLPTRLGVPSEIAVHVLRARCVVEAGR